MIVTRTATWFAIASALVLMGCSDDGGGGGGTGGTTPATGGSGGASTGGTGGANTGGANTGGANTGGVNTGGANTGGANTGGTGGGADGGTGGSVTDYAPQSVEGKSITFTEVGGLSNKWIFGADTAQLEGVDTFPYTFEKDAVNHTIIVFDVQGSDQYDMTWESATTGSCQESFNGQPGNPCTFVME